MAGGIARGHGPVGSGAGSLIAEASVFTGLRRPALLLRDGHHSTGAFPGRETLFPAGEGPRKQGKRGLVACFCARGSCSRASNTSARPGNAFSGGQMTFSFRGKGSADGGNAGSPGPKRPNRARTRRAGGSCWLTAAALVSGPTRVQGAAAGIFPMPARAQLIPER